MKCVPASRRRQQLAEVNQRFTAATLNFKRFAALLAEIEAIVKNGNGEGLPTRCAAARTLWAEHERFMRSVESPCCPSRALAAVELILDAGAAGRSPIEIRRMLHVKRLSRMTEGG